LFIQQSLTPHTYMPILLSLTGTNSSFCIPSVFVSLIITFTSLFLDSSTRTRLALINSRPE
ncbi:hypothetical protein, partial [Klebsiella pneumoniae]|uniref:hypothetical protein n=1 Tax=Klebsiella pneumoniae TaxID=573 RepID=UPI001D0E6C25